MRELSLPSTVNSTSSSNSSSINSSTNNSESEEIDDLAFIGRSRQAQFRGSL